jgi:hypothetical protein
MPDFSEQVYDPDIDKGIVLFCFHPVFELLSFQENPPANA